MQFAPRWVVVVVAVVVAVVSAYLAYEVEIFRWSKVQALVGKRPAEQGQDVATPAEGADEPVAAAVGPAPDSGGSS